MDQVDQQCSTPPRQSNWNICSFRSSPRWHRTTDAYHSWSNAESLSCPCLADEKVPWDSWDPGRSCLDLEWKYLMYLYVFTLNECRCFDVVPHILLYIYIYRLFIFDCVPPPPVPLPHTPPPRHTLVSTSHCLVLNVNIFWSCKKENITCGYLWGLPVLICMVVCIFCFFLHLLACINTSIVYHLYNILHLVYVPCCVKIVVHFCEHPDDLMLDSSLWSVDAWFAATVVASLAKLMHFPMAVQFICSVHFLLLQARMLQCPRVKTRSGCRRGYVSCCQEMVQKMAVECERLRDWLQFALLWHVFTTFALLAAHSCHASNHIPRKHWRNGDGRS